MKMRKRIKRILTQNPAFFGLACFLTRKKPKVFVYHRFCEESNCRGHRTDMDTFRWQIGVIKKVFRIMTFGECLERKEKDGRWPDYSVVLTVDDGYFDFYRCVLPLVREMDVPMTFFVTGNFVDGKIWLWPDKIEYLLKNTRTKRLALNFNGQDDVYDIDDDPANQEWTWKVLVDRCIAMKNEDKEKFLQMLEEKLEVVLPDRPVPEYAAISWKQLREVVAEGVEIGSHTMNHPILSKITEGHVREEVVSSKKFIEERLGQGVVSFCYPNSGPRDITPYVVEMTRMAGYRGAVQGGGVPGEDLFRIPRIAACGDRNEFLWKLCGMEVLVDSFKKKFVPRFKPQEGAYER